MIRIGTSGWVYPPWRGGFYPPGLAQRRELEHLSRRVNAIEINGSFYTLQRPTSYQAWAAQTPEGFAFAVKGGRFITHLKKLRDVETPLANFFASGVLALGPKLGRLDGRAWTVTDADRPLHHALEVRHPSFRDPAFVALLRAHDVALVVADSAGTWPYLEDVTADLVYLRLHGDAELYTSGYTDAALDGWAARVRGWHTGESPPAEHLVGPPAEARSRDVWVFFDNDVKVRAPVDAIALANRLGLGRD